MFINCCTLSSWNRNSNSICCLSNHVVEQKPMDIQKPFPMPVRCMMDYVGFWGRQFLSNILDLKTRGNKRYVVTTCYDKTWPKLNCGKTFGPGWFLPETAQEKNKKNDDGDDDDEDKEEEEANQEQHTKNESVDQSEHQHRDKLHNIFSDLFLLLLTVSSYYLYS